MVPVLAALPHSPSPDADGQRIQGPLAGPGVDQSGI